MICTTCGGRGSLPSLDDEEAMRGIEDACYHCQMTGRCKAPDCTTCREE